jgi:sodium transport system permease protein
MTLSAMLVVARKELVDAFRDRRSIRAMLLPALFGPLMIAFILKQQTVQTKAAESIRLPVVGREYAPVLMNWLQQQPGVELVEGPTDPEAAVRERTEEVVLVVKKEFGGDFEQSKSAPIQVFADSTRSSALPKVRRLSALLNRFNGETAALRLIVRGVSPEVASPLKIEDVDLANSQQRAATVLNVILVFLAIAILTGGMQVATDSTAGERERGSLEPLLLNPVPRWQLLGGKWLAGVLMSLMGMFVTLAVISFVLSRIALEDLGLRFHMGQPKMLLLTATMAPLALAFPAMQAYLASFAKSFKEAQSYTVFLVLPVSAIGVVMDFYPVANRPWMRAIPVVAQYSLGAEILAGKVPSALAMTAAGTEGVIIAVIFIWLSARLFSNEKIIFGR